MRMDFHVHTYFEHYDAEKVVNAMKKNNVGAVGLAGFNRDAFDDNRAILEGTKREGFKVESDDLLARVTDEEGKNFYFPRIGEWENEDGWHLLILGNQKNITKHAPLEENIEEALNQNSFVVIDHPFVAVTYEDIPKDKEEFLYKLCNKYSGKIALEWNGYCIPQLRNIIDNFCVPLRVIGKKVEFGNVNKKLEYFVNKLDEDTINCPLIADTDLHARFPKDLNLIGTASIDTDISLESGKSFIDSLKEKVFSKQYELDRGYVPSTHFIFSYALPFILTPKFIREKIRVRG